jgi:hypothetical protein
MCVCLAGPPPRNIHRNLGARSAGSRKAATQNQAPRRFLRRDSRARQHAMLTPATAEHRERLASAARWVLCGSSDASAARWILCGANGSRAPQGLLMPAAAEHRERLASAARWVLCGANGLRVAGRLAEAGNCRAPQTARGWQWLVLCGAKVSRVPHGGFCAEPTACECRTVGSVSRTRRARAPCGSAHHELHELMRHPCAR